MLASIEVLQKAPNAPILARQVQELPTVTGGVKSAVLVAEWYERGAMASFMSRLQDPSVVQVVVACRCAEANSGQVEFLCGDYGRRLIAAYLWQT